MPALSGSVLVLAAGEGGTANPVDGDAMLAAVVIAAASGIAGTGTTIAGAAGLITSFVATGVGVVTGGSGGFGGMQSIANTASNAEVAGSDDESLEGTTGMPSTGSNRSASELSKLGKPAQSEGAIVIEEETFIELSWYSAPKNRVAECHRITMALCAKRISRSNAGMELR